MELDMSAREAKYQHVIEWVKQKIADGTFREGDKLMSENEMSSLFGLSRQTIRRATGELVNQKLVTRIQGSGTYIGQMLSESHEEQKAPDESSGETLPGEQINPADNDKKVESTVISVRRPTMNIAVISTFNESYIFPGILKGIGDVLTDRGYAMQVSFTDNRLYREAAILQMLLEKDNIDGLIIEPVKSALPNPNAPYYRKLQEKGIPVLFFNAFYPEINAPCVRIDDEAAAETATKMLLDAGHEKIGAIFKSDDGQGPLRYKGYMKAMSRAGCHTEQDSVLWLDTPAASGMELIGDYLFDRLKGCSGIVCYNDQIAYQLIGMALERDIRVPGDLSVVGIDDSYLANVCKVPFASVAHPKEALGRKAAENLVRMISDPAFDGNCLMESFAVMRDSVAYCKKTEDC